MYILFVLGELIERAIPDNNDDKFIDPDEDLIEDEDEDYIPPTSETKKSDLSNDNVSNAKTDNSPIKPSHENVKTEFIEQTVINTTLLKPDISELPKQSNRETLSYLKAKRIIRHKNNVNNEGGPESKKAKTLESADT